MPVTDEQGAAGVLPVQVGGETRFVPVLPMAYADNWSAKLSTALSAVGDAAELADGENQDQLLRRIALLTNEKALELVLEWDRRNVLGGRAWLMENASAGQVYRALEAMKAETLPSAELATLAVMLTEVITSRSRSSTNGHSPNGTSPSLTSVNGSRTGSSASSGKPARSASRAKRVSA